MPRRRLALCRVRCFAELWADFVLRSCGRVVRQYGRTALMVAAYNGHTDIARLLLERGADVNLVDYVSAAWDRRTRVVVAKE